MDGEEEEKRGGGGGGRAFLRRVIVRGQRWQRMSSTQ